MQFRCRSRNSLLFFLISYFSFATTEAYDALDPNGNITIKWDVISWTPDGYVGVVSIYNFQQYRHIEAPGWSLGWTWSKLEVIWNIIGSQATEQGNCSMFKGNIPHSCHKSPTIVDLLPNTPYNQQVANCCKGGVLTTPLQDPSNAQASFQISVGSAGTTNNTVKLPKNFTFTAPGLGYTCGPAKIVKPTKFISQDRRRFTQAMMTWDVTCTYSQFLAPKIPTCCASFSSVYNKTLVSCPTCTCGCQNNHTCVNPHTKRMKRDGFGPVVQCSSHMCPIGIHWQVTMNNKDFWRVKVTITNFNYRMNYTQWNIVVQHPNFDNLTRISAFNYKPLTPYNNLNDIAMFWGIEDQNDLLMPIGNVHTELQFRKDNSTYTLGKGWAFPRHIYFNGDRCSMPSSNAYPYLPKG